MASRISISISEALHEKIQEHKKNIKISRVCQRALVNEVMALEFWEADQGKIKLLSKRLRDEQMMEYKPFFDEGHLDGQKDAYKVNLSEFKKYLKIQEDNYGDLPQDWSISLVDLLQMGLCSKRSERKYHALAVAEYIVEEDEDRKKAIEQFYKSVEGDLRKKGFKDDKGFRWLVEEEESDYGLFADTYEAGWLTGHHAVLSQVNMIDLGEKNENY